MRAYPARVTERLVPQEPRLGWVVLLRAVEELRVCALWISINRRTGPDAGVELGRGFVPRRDRHREVERGFDRAPGGSGQVPGIKADMRAEACVSLVG
jgi:hypothetical protein